MTASPAEPCRVSRRSRSRSQGLDLQSGPGDGVGASGAINVVTRRGTSTTSGAAFLDYRATQDLAAFPGSATPAWCAVARLRPPADRWQRRRSAGPRPGVLVRQLRAQHSGRGVCRQQQPSDSFPSSMESPEPAHIEFANIRLDGRMSARHQVSFRVSTDRNHTNAPAVAVGMPSNWQSVENKAFQVQTGVTSILTGTR